MQHLKIQLMTSRSLYVFSVGFELFENWLEMKTEFPFQKVDLRAVLKNQLKSKRWWNWFPCNVSFCSSSLPLPNLYLSSEESTPAIRQKTSIQMEIMLGHAVLTYTHTLRPTNALLIHNSVECLCENHVVTENEIIVLAWHDEATHLPPHFQ